MNEAAMRQAGRLVALAHQAVRTLVQPGVSTRELDAVIERVIVEGGGRPAFKGYHGFPAATCCSPNEVVVHGFPNGRKLRGGEIVSLDIGAVVDGYHGDSAWTYAVGDVSPEVQKLLAATEAALYAGLAAARAGNHVEDIGAAIEDAILPTGFGIVRDYGGHGIGLKLHDDPHVANYRTGFKGARLQAGQGLAIEPMITLGGPALKTKADGWTVVTRDGSWAAHFEHTILVRAGAPEILTSLTGS